MAMNLNVFSNPRQVETNVFGPLGNHVYVSRTGSSQGDGSVMNPYKTIQGALDHADPGDIIHVAPGTYVENITITERVHLVGMDRRSCIIRSAVAASVVVTATAAGAANAVISNLTLEALDNGVTAPATVLAVGQTIEVENCVIGTNAAIAVANVVTGIAITAGSPVFRDCIVNFAGVNIMTVVGGATPEFNRCDINILAPIVASPGPSAVITAPVGAAPLNTTVTLRDCNVQGIKDGALFDMNGAAAGAIARLNAHNSEFNNTLGATPAVVTEGLIANVTRGAGVGDSIAAFSNCTLRPNTFYGDVFPAPAATFLVGSIGGAATGGVLLMMGTKFENPLGGNIINEADGVTLTTGDVLLNGGDAYRNNMGYDGVGGIIAEAVGAAAVWDTRIPRTNEEAIARLADQVARITDTLTSTGTAGPGQVIVATREGTP